MKTKLVSLLSLLILFCFTISLYAAPTVGSWVVYKVTDKGVRQNNRPSEYTLKISVVGQEKVNGKDYFWYEFAKTESGDTVITKVLAKPESADSLSDRLDFYQDLQKIIIQNPGQKPQEVNQNAFARYDPHPVQSKKASTRRNAKIIKGPTVATKDTETLQIGGKSLKCTVKEESKTEHAQINLGFINLEDTSRFKTIVYLNDEVPITGVAKFMLNIETESKNQRPNQGTQAKEPRTAESVLLLTNFGKKGATSMITEQPEIMPENPFPFLKTK